MTLRLVHDSAWNLMGFVVPAAASFVAMPFLFHRLGSEQFGLLTLAWVMLGIANTFDFGIGRAVTMRVAELAAQDRTADISATLATGLFLSRVIGALLFVVLLVAVKAGALGAFTVSDRLRPEAQTALLFLGVGIVASIYGSALRGGLEGFSAFRNVNIVKAVSGTAMFLLPCLVAVFTQNQAIIVAALVASRVLANVALRLFLKQRSRLDWTSVNAGSCRDMLRYGGWITVSSLLGPIIVYADRFVVSSVLSPSAVAYLSVASDALSRILVLPVSVATAAFPAISSDRNNPKIRDMVRSATLMVAAIVLPVTVILLLSGRWLLELWMGLAFATASVDVFRLLAVGFGFNALAQVPFITLQAKGQARLTALWHSLQFVPYIAALIIMSQAYGIVGAALTWSMRAAIDCLGMWWLLARNMGATSDGPA